MTDTVLVLGASGRFGRHAAAAFSAAGWEVRRHDRARGDLMAEAQGADVIVAGWNPPYTAWEREVPAQTERVIAAARAAGATVIVPGNTYVFGKGSGPVLSADTPHGATNPLGRVRVAMESAWVGSGVKVIMLRAGDFIDTEASGNWFDAVMTRGLARGRFRYPGPLDVPHAWAFLPDLARAAVALAEKRDLLGRFEEVPFPGYTITGREMDAALAAAAGRPLNVASMSWLPLQLARPFWPMGRRLLEVRYLWSMPHRLDGTRLAELLPDFEATPLQAALWQAVQHQIDPDQPVTKPAGFASAG